MNVADMDHRAFRVFRKDDLVGHHREPTPSGLSRKECPDTSHLKTGRQLVRVCFVQNCSE